LIVASAFAAVIETEPSVIAGREDLFQLLEWAFGGVFAVEYAARVWAAGENPRYAGGLAGRLRYAASPAALLDLLALSASLLPFTGHQPFLLRLVRLLRIVRIARLGRFSAAMQIVLQALAERRYEMLVSMMIAAMLILISATLLYFAEGETQPEAFGSIPRAMWWSVVTLTTVGYGDAAPVTPFGRVLAALTCIGGIGLIAMPTGILAAAFSDAMRRKAEAESEASERDRR
jgi:voltage-gated potassium channel